VALFKSGNGAESCCFTFSTWFALSWWCHDLWNSFFTSLLTCFHSAVGFQAETVNPLFLWSLRFFGCILRVGCSPYHALIQNSFLFLCSLSLVPPSERAPTPASLLPTSLPVATRLVISLTLLYPDLSWSRYRPTTSPSPVFFPL